jgi:hypothetical protein
MILTPLLKIVCCTQEADAGKYNNPKKVWQGFFATYMYPIGYQGYFVSRPFLLVLPGFLA